MEKHMLRALLRPPPTDMIYTPVVRQINWIIEYPGLMLDTGPIEGWDAFKPLYWRSVNSKDSGRPCLKHHHRGVWNGIKRNEWNECGEMVKWNLWQGKWEKPLEKPTQAPFPPSRNLHGETRTWDPSGGRWASNRLRHGADTNQLFFLTMTEVKDDMKWMNGYMKWHEEEVLKNGECWWNTILRKRGKKKQKQNPDIAYYNCLPAHNEIPSLDPSKDKRSV